LEIERLVKEIVEGDESDQIKDLYLRQTAEKCLHELWKRRSVKEIRAITNMALATERDSINAQEEST
jgi:hypothetical protein